MEPQHLQKLTHAIERAEKEPIRALVSIPPRHSKSETLLHAIAWWLKRHPEQTVAYVTYSDTLTKSKSRLARQYARAAGVQLADDATKLNEWRTEQGGGALFTSIGGPFTGQGCQMLIIDDPHKDRAEAESQLIRDNTFDWYRGTAYSRVEPGGSIIVTHTRWHPDDLIGRLEKDDSEPWETVFLPAISEDGKALWPSRWPLGELLKKKAGVGEYEWASLYMGQPRPKGGSVFHDVVFADTLPSSGYRITIGVDMAYSAKSHADYSVAVVLMQHGQDIYVVDVRRMQVEARIFAATLRELLGSYPGARALWYTSTTEQGLANLMSSFGIPVQAAIAKADKFVRAQPVAAYWNMGRIKVLRNAPWASAFVSEVASFTGVADRHDDQVDALAAAYDLFMMPTVRRDFTNLPPR